MNLTNRTAMIGALRDLRLVQYALTDRSVQMTGANTTFLAGEADAIWQAVNTLQAILNVEEQGAGS